MSVSRLNGSPFDKSGQDSDIRNICDGITENYFISSSSIGIVHTQGTKLNLEVTQGDYKTLMTC